MNLLDKIELTLIIIAIFFFFACETPSDVGLNLDPNGLGVSVLYKEIPLVASNVLVDSTVTSKMDLLYIGKESSALFGTTTATGYGKLNYTNSIYVPEDTAVLNDLTKRGKMIYKYDSAIFMFQVNKLHSDGLSQAMQSFTVHPLTDTLFTSVSYYAHHKTDFDASKILATVPVSLEFSTRPAFDSKHFVYSKLDDELGKKIFDFQTARDGTAATNLAKELLGVAIVPHLSNNVLLGLTPEDSTGIRVYYHLVDFYNETVDNIVLEKTRRIKDTVINVGMLDQQYYSQLTNDKKGTITSVGNSKGFYNAFSVGEFAYIQPISGIFPKVDLSPLLAFFKLEENKNIQINRLEFEIDIVDNTLASRYYANTEQLRFYSLSSDGSKINPYGKYYGGVFNNTNEGLVSTTIPTDDNKVSILGEPVLQGLAHICVPTIYAIYLENGKFHVDDQLKKDHLLIYPKKTFTPDFGIFKKNGGMKINLYYTIPK